MWRFPWVALLDHHDWVTGNSESLTVNIGLSVMAIYQRLSASQASLGGTRSFGDLLLALLLFVAGLFLIIEVGALAMGLALARSITGAVHELFAGTERVRQGDFGHRIPVLANDQLGELANSFNQMTGSIEDLLRQTAEKKRLEEEMRLAREIQMSLLPRGPLLIPGIAISAMCVPAREVGGDYYDILPLPDGRYGLLIADVSGKGMSAALYMAELKGLILSLSQIHSSPRDLLISANRLISMHLDSRSFITMTYAVIDPAAGVMTYARAGHTPLLYLPGDSGAGGRTQTLVPDGLVLGLRIDDGERFDALLVEATLHLRPRDLFSSSPTESARR
jgi:sigma-B regulation protein RsbU (phosphoserine phosphatase)